MSVLDTSICDVYNINVRLVSYTVNATSHAPFHARHRPEVLPILDTQRSEVSSRAESDVSEVMSTSTYEALDYPFFIAGGRKVVQQGCVLPAGVRIRHPSLLFGKNFRKSIKEFLYVWDTTKGKEDRAFLASKIRALWIQNGIFKQWAGNVYDRNEQRAVRLKKARIR